MPVSELKWHSNVADVILKGLEELQQDIGDINKNLRNGKFVVRRKVSWLINFI